MNDNYSFQSISPSTPVTLQFLQWCDREHYLNLYNNKCNRCRNQTLTLQQKVDHQLDQHILRCPHCRKAFSVRLGSIFHHHNRIPITTIFRVIYLLQTKCTMQFIAEENNISTNTVSSIHQTLIKFYVMRYHRRNPIRFSVEDSIIEIDETPENWRWGALSGTWVLGIISRETRKVLIVPIRDRGATDILPCIDRVIESGAWIITDGYNLYNYLDNDYAHLVINKAQEGINNYDSNSDININVNKIECTWKHFRDLLERHHSPQQTHVTLCAHHYCYIYNHHTFENVIKIQ